MLEISKKNILLWFLFAFLLFFASVSNSTNDIIMEPSTKLRRCSSPSPTQEEEETANDGKDRLSDLPSDVAHHILSYLTVADIARLSWTSKRCKQICLSNPSLIIDSDKVDFGEGSVYLTRKIMFLDYLVDFMRSHQVHVGGLKLDKLCLRWNKYLSLKRDMPHIMSILSNAVNCSIQEVYIGAKMKLCLPLDLLLCKSLRSLTVNLRHDYLGIPVSYKFAHLESLTIERVTIHDHNNLGEWISSFCRFLKKLQLENIRFQVNELRISSSSLQDVTITDCAIKQFDFYAENLKSMSLTFPSWLPGGGSAANVSAPNLSALICGGYGPENLSFGEMNLLQSASLCLSSLGGRRMRMKGLVSNMAHVQCLVITSRCIKALHKDDCLPIRCSDLQKVELRNAVLTDDLVPAIAFFLEGLPPSLKMLSVTPDSELRYSKKDLKCAETSGYKARYWQSKNCSFMAGLKELELELVGVKNEVVLVKHLLASARSLKKLLVSREAGMPMKIANILLAVASARRASIHSVGQKMILEFNP